MLRKFTLLANLLALLTACAPAAPRSGPAILASTTFLADIAQNVAGDRLMVESLLPPGADPHSFQPTPEDLAKISDSTILIVNGVDYEHFLETILENADGERLLITASAGIDPRHMPEHEGEDKHGHEAGDPHMWLDPNLVIVYVENLRAGLTEADPAGAAVYQANAAAYVAQLNELDAWIVEQVMQIPADRRLLVTNHEALGYFADRYGFQIAGTLLTSVSSAASPSARELSQVIDEIRASGAPAIFLDEVENPNFAQQIAEETGVLVVADLHLESLTSGGPAATYLDMQKYNVSRIVEALK
jgi:ABC-type Zn uptake system ZnuABC Zn-binding protein ZnuA